MVCKPYTKSFLKFDSVFAPKVINRANRILVKLITIITIIMTFI